MNDGDERQFQDKRTTIEVVSKPQITFKSKAQLDEKAEHIQ
jgi:hypothetical protein